MQAPSKGTRLARFDMSDELEDHASQRVLFTDMDGLQSAANNPTFVTEENKDGLDEIRHVLELVCTSLGISIDIICYTSQFCLCGISTSGWS